jgi:low temperature requirement protein LtrA
VSEQHAEREQRVTPLELFFDLVFVFGFTQVTTVLSDDPTWGGLGHGLLILAALWWAWAAYAWLTNTVDPGVGAVWGAMLVAMAAMFVAALAVPDAFGRSWGRVRSCIPDRERHASRAVRARSAR